MTDIYILVDYLDRFESKVPAIPYRSGFDKELLRNEFVNLGYNPIFMNYAEIDFSKINFKDKYVLYTSIEDEGLFYKDFIEDIIWGIKLQGGILIPRLEIHRAHHNKVFMEILRTVNKIDDSLQSRYFGSIKELINNQNGLNYPIVLKSASGAGSRGVKLARNNKQLIKKAKELSNTNTWFNYFKEYGLLIKRLYQTKRIFKTESLFRKKIIVQNFIPNLTKDWKVLIYGNKYYILERSIRKNDFRASGSGMFRSSNDLDFVLPNGLLDFAKKLKTIINIPNLSVDIALSDGKYYLIEFQGISFGTLTQTISNSYYSFQNDNWIEINDKRLLENVYAESIDTFIQLNS